MRTPARSQDAFLTGSYTAGTSKNTRTGTARILGRKKPCKGGDVGNTHFAATKCLLQKSCPSFSFCCRCGSRLYMHTLILVDARCSNGKMCAYPELQLYLLHAPLRSYSSYRSYIPVLLTLCTVELGFGTLTPWFMPTLF
jgi:hypothetical protein